MQPVENGGQSGEDTRLTHDRCISTAGPLGYSRSSYRWNATCHTVPRPRRGAHAAVQQKISSNATALAKRILLEAKQWLLVGMHAQLLVGVCRAFRWRELSRHHPTPLCSEYHTHQAVTQCGPSLSSNSLSPCSQRAKRHVPVQHVTAPSNSPEIKLLQRRETCEGPCEGLASVRTEPVEPAAGSGGRSPTAASTIKVLPGHECRLPGELGVGDPLNEQSSPEAAPPAPPPLFTTGE